MSVQLHLLNARGALNSVFGLVENAFPGTVETIQELLPISDVDVVIYADKRFTLPEIGMCGYSPSADRVFVAVDPDNPNFHRLFHREFAAMLGHELHHCKRWAGPGYGRTLGEALVSEGLACHFESQLRGGSAPFYANALHDDVRAVWLAHARTG